MASTTVVNGRPPDEAAAAAVKGGEFPKDTLKESLRVAEAIQQANAGQPYPPLETANAMGLSPASSGFRTLLAASAKRNLTIGSHMAKRITLLETGQDIVAPKSEASAGAAIRSASPQLSGIPSS